jgi:hypothetical protein
MRRDWVKAWRDLRSRSQAFLVPVDPESRDSVFPRDVLSATALLTVLTFCTSALGRLAAAKRVLGLPRAQLAALATSPRNGAR